MPPQRACRAASALTFAARRQRLSCPDDVTTMARMRDHRLDDAAARRDGRSSSPCHRVHRAASARAVTRRTAIAARRRCRGRRRELGVGRAAHRLLRRLLAALARRAQREKAAAHEWRRRQGRRTRRHAGRRERRRLCRVPRCCPPFAPDRRSPSRSRSRRSAHSPPSAADTWATEIGTLFGGTPRSISHAAPRSARNVGRRERSPARSPWSSAQRSSQAPRIALDRTCDVRSSIVAGIAGALADSLIGATLQERRWCATCDRASERRVHDCGTTTRHGGGREWMDNDLVNLIATFVGAAVAALLAYALAFIE